KKVAVFRKEHFNAAHRLFNPAWDMAKNDAVFGKCNNPSFHGHNYEVIIKVVGVPDPETGYVMDMKVLSDIMKEHVIEKLDHKNLNLDTPFFKDRNPTAENICILIFELMRKLVDPRHQIQIRLYETERNFVEYPVDPA
ncbi:MAG: 6-carboxytetrahydropterin synthase, partial [Chitinophagaceae bacterium]